MIIIYVDIILLSVLFLLILFTCGFCIYRIHGMQQNGQVAYFLRPTKVLFSHKNQEDGSEQLRSVVAYRNPFTGDYCVNKSQASHGYMNQLPPDASSPDSGLSDDRYEPLGPPLGTLPLKNAIAAEAVKSPAATPIYDNSITKTWKWDYTEYQI
ncbi:uncharacterized protein LOC116777155 isoform X1 [Danaus plexippus]|uniref:uncharacterized protein LOC116777155 isoform X1 n=2 Tax=Danaus plexippus TaxID=13037 RepID=UPI0013C50901|nr:uncharacterized protein LOC116777155 isoform X1 [Danaus plexippus]